jgi:hypothetical protein
MYILRTVRTVRKYVVLLLPEGLWFGGSIIKVEV